jgi:NTE family protein
VVSIGLVLGAGGVVGQAWHAGVLAAVADTIGWDAGTAEMVVGTSAGSGVGAALRRGVTVHDLMARATGTPLSPAGQRLLGGVPVPAAGLRRPSGAPLRAPASPSALIRAAAAPWRARPGAVAAAALPAGRIPTDGIGDAMRALYGDQRWPPDSLWICAVRLDTGERTVFGREGSPPIDIGTAVEASCAIPGFFAPVTFDGVRYVDGGAHSPTNLDLLAGQALDLVVVSSPMSAAERGIDGRSALRAVTTLRLAAEVRAVRRRGTPALTFQPTRADLDVMGWNAMDGTKRDAVARQAYASATRRLADRRAQDRIELLQGA